ncbi:bifunctional protein-serine/threonine kinase/phosphatase [Eleftheria terrae]|uniref:bifunctional protein-serine/threonine kinase/phosphatase n=1 Tax=Eleftheria terrae TaxID=1597781 RepID=UPI00263A8FF3|nr:bifunctional protein-serine/threonine kinase/phosphatase [Eleftheria terrae]WKB53965.1 bifunctional protein-serine/threonine kinase/phosphatase [Eleftheria terrae]
MGLEVDVGHCSERGPRPGNEDFAAAVAPPPGEAARGWIAALADGVSAGGHGAEAAQTAVLSLVRDYHATPDTWDTTVALDRLIGAHNAWLADHNRRRAGPAAMCTLTAVVLQGQGYTVAHVGDTRAWLLRDGECVQLTQDHSFDHPDLRHRLMRALGLDDLVRVDYLQGRLQADDVLLLTSDGVHRALKRSRLAALALHGDASLASEAIVREAVAAGSRDNATALVMRVLHLAEARLEDMLLLGRQLPVPPRLKAGDRLDGHVIEVLVSDDGVHRLYRAREPVRGEPVALKTLHEARAADPQERAMLAHEAWLGSRAGSGFVRLREQRDASAFYLVFDWHEGQTLEQCLASGRRFGVDQVVAAALAVVRALGGLHRQGVIHRDIKPANLHLGVDGQWRVLDLGAAVSGREPQAQRLLHAGTPSYMNPEQWPGPHGDAEPADAASDLYALGVTLYRWLTGRLPYGEIEPYQSGRFRRDPCAPSRSRPDVPIWLDHVVLKAVAREKAQRFETAEEFALALERGASRPLPAPGATPLVARDEAALWKIGLGLSLLFNLLLVIWLLFLPR